MKNGSDKSISVPEAARPSEGVPNSSPGDELKPYFRDLHLCFDQAWRKWMELAILAPKQFNSIKARARANVVCDFVVEAVTERFANDPKVVLKNPNGFLLMIINNRYALRFKKLDRNRLTCRGHTPAFNAYFAQQQLSLPLMPPEIVRLVAGYQVDSAQANLKDVLLTLQCGRTVVWFESIVDVAVEVRDRDANPANDSSTPAGEMPKKRRVKATVVPKMPKKMPDGEGPAGSPDDTR